MVVKTYNVRRQILNRLMTQDGATKNWLAIPSCISGSQENILLHPSVSQAHHNDKYWPYCNVQLRWQSEDPTIEKGNIAVNFFNEL